MALLDKCDFSSYNAEVDYCTAQMILEAQYNIRIRRSINTEQIEEKGMLLKCASCGKPFPVKTALGITLAQTYCCGACYERAQLQTQWKKYKNESQNQRKTVENKIDNDEPSYDNNPNFLEIH